METISLVVPCYNEQESITLFYDTVEKVFAGMNKDSKKYVPDYIFINDGSSDNTLKILNELHNQHPETVHFISFSRNFGKESAITAGLRSANGDYIALMDVDLQDPPELLPKMLKIITTEDYDCVGCIQTSRKQNPIRAFLSSTFYHVIDRLSDVKIKPNVRDYRLMTRQYVDAVNDLTEYNRFSKGIFSWVGFNTKYIKYAGRERAAGETHWSMIQLLEYSIEGIIDFSDAPLKVATWVGGLSCFFAVLGIIFTVIRTICFGGSVAGWPSLVSIMLLIGGIQLFCLGILGKYIGKIYLETKHRPQYIIKEQK
ncbi:glycosyltransferase family 2 protein [Fructilactobacillus sanfranciscensis]|uniref:Putative glycosyltransferase csbB n=1 Tax=Fructilactobacillus sanfranciscensis (strain TMW 1.1304) TaxID=714313 RepID=G2KVS4_FRUST|nr:glycosyltransferase family 2 protein [Fructilactobacillus sanfranciscensis]AEN99453.1 Putative glycosyltransferase csbB [Fructilactobacillus sanfranciscensis TMW 1.1304]MCG7196132.1 glycosyltransferase [Fructilactobacillus sanfranciscensis]MDN4461896.1 glycosyltransferase family 2 protein [Fructilactobacillus sanfranciscensis]MVF16120.1 glycosyltransferase [Fructilactobacillus sanfranciscensis]NDR61802.1 glycosyltransferase [Fructilactobacillus sanfranciscensis]